MTGADQNIPLYALNMTVFDPKKNGSMNISLLCLDLSLICLDLSLYYWIYPKCEWICHKWNLSIKYDSTCLTGLHYDCPNYNLNCPNYRWNNIFCDLECPNYNNNKT